MTEYYDKFHRWEPLAEFHFNIDDDEDLYDDNYIYCLCSRVFIRDFVKTYYDRREASESEPEVGHTDLQENEDHSHVHFSVDTSYKVKCDKDESASCYCSASHTENYYSTDEHDPALTHSTTHMLQPSDSGADLTYQDSHSEFPIKYKQEGKQQDLEEDNVLENYLSEHTWDKFWSVNGERIIWASWIKKYSDYINPSYLEENNDLLSEDNPIPKTKSSNDLNVEVSSPVDSKGDDSPRERKFSYDSKINPYKKSISNQSSLDKSSRICENTESKDENWLHVARRRSCSEHDRMLSPRTVAGTDSMTNVTKITFSSYDVSSSHVTSESSPTDDYSVSSSTSDDPSNDKTRIAIIDENVESLDTVPLCDTDTEQYWQLLWKKHFGEQYALHYANFIETHDYQENHPSVTVAAIEETTKGDELNDVDETKTQEQPESESKTVEIYSDALSTQECPINDVQDKVDQIDLEDKVTEKVTKNKKRNKKTNSRYMDSVGFLLQNLLKEHKTTETEYTAVVEANDNNTQTKDNNTVAPNSKDVVDSTAPINVMQNSSNNETKRILHDNNDDDKPPEEKAVFLKRSHELDFEEDEDEQPDKITSTFELMGFCMDRDKMPKGEIVYRKRFSRLRPPRNKRGPRKTYFDDDGNPYKAQDAQDEKNTQSGNNCKTSETDADKPPSEDVVSTVENNPNVNDESNIDLVLEASQVALPIDADASFSDVPDNDGPKTETTSDNTASNQVEVKRRRRQKRYKTEEFVDESELPDELKGDRKMIKYWKKRHSLFHRFDSGIKLDRESWFSVTPESVAWHIANKCAHDVVVDAFCGAGGDTLQFAANSRQVIAIDIDPVKIDLARNNARVYGVADKIEFIIGDFFEIGHKFQADMVFLSPPWGGPNYSEASEYDIETMLLPKPASELMKAASKVAPTVVMYLPRNTKTDQILALAKEEECSVEIEQNYLDRRFVAITAYFY